MGSEETGREAARDTGRNTAAVSGAPQREITIESAVLRIEGETCERCCSTVAAVREAVAQLEPMLAEHQLGVRLVEHDLDASQLERSNSVLVNGRPLEALLGAERVATDCPSCADLVGESTCCSAMQIEGTVTESPTADMLVAAVMAGVAGGEMVEASSSLSNPVAERRVALIADIHGNAVALDAVLADIDAAGISELYCLGDLVGYGPEPGRVIETIRRRGIPTIAGNYDDGIGNRRGDCKCYYATDEARRHGEASYAFTDKVIGDVDRTWIAALPERMWLTPDGIVGGGTYAEPHPAPGEAAPGTRTLLVHGSPRLINEYLLTDRTDAQLLRLAENAGADIVLVGHVHIPYHRTITREDGSLVHYVSVGSAGKPKDRDPRACWAEVVLAADGSLAAVEFHRVGYDIDAVAEAMFAAGLPEPLGEALRNA